MTNNSPRTKGNPMTDTDDQAMRDFTKRLFSHADEPDEALPQWPASTESGTPNPGPHDPMRDFVAGLFSNRD